MLYLDLSLHLLVLPLSLFPFFLSFFHMEHIALPLSYFLLDTFYSNSEVFVRKGTDRGQASFEFRSRVTARVDLKICSPLARRRPEVVQLESCTVWSRNNPALERLHCYFGRQKFRRACSRLMRDASHSFAVSAPWPRLLSRVVLQDDDGIKPDLDGRFFIVVLDKTEQSSDYHVIKSRLVIRCSRKNGVSSSLK